MQKKMRRSMDMTLEETVNMDLSYFENSKILISGATGLIGRSIVNTLLSHKGKLPIHVVALVRNRKKAEAIFAGISNENLTFLESDVCALQAESLGVDYIVHAASMTSSRAFVDAPVEVIQTSLKGTERLLEFARSNPVKKFVYLSTMEVYGSQESDAPILESNPTNLDSTRIRSCYPESKRLCECLCSSYFAEYGVPACTVRLTQTFGPGVEYQDGRVFAEFARCVIEERDIVLHTAGDTKRNYLYTADAVNAIFTVLKSGTPGEAYNAANEDTYCSIREMAQLVADMFGKGKTHVVFQKNDNIEKFGYAPTLKMNLCAGKLRALGWKPKVGLEEAYRRMISSMQAELTV